MDYKCLIIDDEVDLANTTCEYFELFGLSTTYVTSIDSYYEFLKENTASLILLDINLGEDSGFKLCKDIRATSNVPILFISARQSDDDILVGLNIGGDDYIKKPYSLNILLAKVKAVLNRYESSIIEVNQEDEVITIDEKAMKVTVQGKEIRLKTKEFKLLNYLFKHKNQVVTKDELFQNVWGDTFFSDGTLNVHIRKIREQIEEDPNNPKLIKTIWGTGYILEL